MKKILLTASLLSALALALATAAQFAGLVSFQTPAPGVFIGGIAAVGVLAFASYDYSRQPSFRVRRTSRHPAKTDPATSRTAIAAGPGWTYSTLSA